MDNSSWKWILEVVPAESFIIDKDNTLLFPNNGLRLSYRKIGDIAELPDKEIKIVWEDWLVYKKEILFSKLRVLTGMAYTIPGRICTVRRISVLESSEFLKKNHLQGSTNAKTKYGIFIPKKYFRLLPVVPEDVEEVLVGVMTFSSGRKFRDGSTSYELLRYCTLLNFRIHGGFSKLLKKFISEKKPDHIMTYTDLDWYHGGSYEKMGFVQTARHPQIFFGVDATGARIANAGYDVFSLGSIKFEWQCPKKL